MVSVVHARTVHRKPARIILVMTEQSIDTDKEKCYNMSHVMGKPGFRICENKDADQLRRDREADQRLCFCYMDSAILILP